MMMIKIKVGAHPKSIMGGGWIMGCRLSSSLKAVFGLCDSQVANHKRKQMNDWVTLFLLLLLLMSTKSQPSDAQFHQTHNNVD